MEDSSEQECDQDEFTRGMRFETDNEVNSEYFSNQKQLAKLLFERLELIWCTRQNKKLEDFVDFDIQIYTVRYIMLQGQTRSRLETPGYSCLPKHLYSEPQSKILQYTEERVHMYNLKDKAVVKRHEDLQREAKENPSKLFLIVVDEAHWGITGTDKKDKKMSKENGGDAEGERVKKAHDKLVNTWTPEDYPNVFLLQVTATPYNLLTEASRLPLDTWCARDKFTDKLIEVKVEQDGSKERLYNTSGEDVTDAVGAKKPVHQVRWSEIYSNKFKDGMHMVIKSLVTCTADYDDKRYPDRQVYLSPPETLAGQEADMIPLFGIAKDDKLEGLLFEGDQDRLRIWTLSRDRCLLVRPVKDHYEVGLAKPDILNAVSTDTFEMVMSFGEDVFGLKTKLNGTELYLYFDQESDFLKVDKRPIIYVASRNVLVNMPPQYLFFIVREKRADELSYNKRYLSLNFYFNTMWNREQRDQLIRNDKALEEMLESLKMKMRSENKNTDLYFDEETGASDILLAQYCIFILARQTIKNMHVTAGAPTTVTELLQSHAVTISAKHEEFRRDLLQNIELSKGQGKLTRAAFNTILMHHQQEVKNCLEREINNLNGYSCPQSRWNTAKNLLLACTLGDVGTLTKYASQVSSDVLHFFLEDNIQVLKDMAIDHYETYKIVDDLMKAFDSVDVEGISDTPVKVKGTMKVIRVASIYVAGKWYETLCIARHIATPKHYLFDVLKDCGSTNYKTEFYNKFCEEKYYLQRQIQTRKCNFVKNEKKTLKENCSCEHYEPQPPITKCLNCDHYHKNLTIYEDLEDVPCILIIVEKGRMGDTFPKSFNVMDLRLRHSKKGDKINLSSMVQELGRLCRYTFIENFHSLPYALVGKQLHDQLKEEGKHEPNTLKFKGNGIYYGSFFLSGNIDSYASLDKKKIKPENNIWKFPLRAGERSYDGEKQRESTEQNKKVDNYNRILLEAEPQCGKTGTFCCLISMLMQAICERNEAVELEGDSEDEEAEEAIEEAPASRNPLDLEHCWQYPYWQHLQDDKGTFKITSYSKYNRLFGTWKSGSTLPRQAGFLHPPQKCKNKPLKPTKAITSTASYRTETAAHNHTACSLCNKPYQASTHKITVLAGDNKYDTLISVPNWMRYSALMDKFQTIHCDTLIGTINISLESYDSQIIQLKSFETDLKTWIFMPTHKRAMDGCLNLLHSMVEAKSEDDSNLVSKSYIQILVVREEEFQLYISEWGKTCAVLQLPNSLHTDSGELVAVDVGGIGYARRFAQLFAQHCNLDHIFMLDDNIYYVQEPKFEDGYIYRKEEDTVQLECVPLYKVLKHLEDQFSPEGAPPKPVEKYTPCPDYDIFSYELERYTGPFLKYAVTGVRKARKGSDRVVKPFKKTHVYSLVMLHISALSQKELLYKPWEAREDVDLNDRCHKANLWVCKYNRFLLFKKRMKSSMGLYVWKDDTRLTSGEKPVADKEVVILRKNIAKALPPRVKYRQSDGQAHGPDHEKSTEALYELFLHVEKMKPETEVHFVSVDLATHSSGEEISQAPARDTLRRHLTGTPGLASYEWHVIAFSADACRKHGLTTKANFFKFFKEFFVNLTPENFNVVTSHIVKDYNVSVVVVVIYALIKDALSDLAVPAKIPSKFNADGLAMNHSVSDGSNATIGNYDQQEPDTSSIKPDSPGSSSSIFSQSFPSSFHQDGGLDDDTEGEVDSEPESDDESLLTPKLAEIASAKPGLENSGNAAGLTSYIHAGNVQASLSENEPDSDEESLLTPKPAVLAGHVHANATHVQSPVSIDGHTSTTPSDQPFTHYAPLESYTLEEIQISRPSSRKNGKTVLIPATANMKLRVSDHIIMRDVNSTPDLRRIELTKKHYNIREGSANSNKQSPHKASPGSVASSPRASSTADRAPSRTYAPRLQSAEKNGIQSLDDDVIIVTAEKKGVYDLSHLSSGKFKFCEPLSSNTTSAASMPTQSQLSQKRKSQENQPYVAVKTSRPDSSMKWYLPLDMKAGNATSPRQPKTS